MNFTRQNIPDIVPCQDIADYVPGELKSSSEESNWQGLLVTQYDYHDRNFDYAVPATAEHLLVYMKSGVAKGHYSYNYGAFTSFEGRKGEWLIGQAYENRMDWNWQANCPKEEPLSFIRIYLGADLLKTAAESLGIDSAKIELSHYIDMRDPLMEQFAITLEKETKVGLVTNQIFIDSMAQCLALHLLRNHCVQRYNIPAYKEKLCFKKLHRVTDYIRGNLHQDLSLKTMADLAGCCESFFIGMFNKSLGITPHQYIMRCRIKKAKQLLRHTDWPITRIAMEVGYYQPAHFSVLFKQLVGVAPSKYRQSVCNE